jgi:hypothetical protein
MAQFLISTKPVEKKADTRTIRNYQALRSHANQLDIRAKILEDRSD